ncbi:hypothetical protein [Methanobrevibacter arboriphilus]|uniref:hypothetical protein n=1 Tax=Methanobrevibacter arboriphilus TaxID=39441 RepID=UPI000A8B7694|nr:hypothetical protein [Methanobrevibacter arboriphilus]
MNLLQKNLVIFPGSPDQTIYVRGPYNVDSALENQSTIIRMPQDALNTLELSYGDKLRIGDEYYTINKARNEEPNILRIPYDVRMFLDLQVGDVISDGKIKGVFEGIQVEHSFNINDSNISGSEYSIINSRNMNGTTMDVYVDHNRVGSISGSFKPNETYDIYVNGLIAKSIYINDDIKEEIAISFILEIILLN